MDLIMTIIPYEFLIGLVIGLLCGYVAGYVGKGGNFQWKPTIHKTKTVVTQHPVGAPIKKEDDASSKT